MKPSILLFFLFIAATTNAQKTAGGVTFLSPVMMEGEELLLNGVGIRSKFFIDMYACALYLPAESSDAKEIIRAIRPMSIKIHIISRLITSERMTEAVDEGFKNATGGNTEPIASEIKKFKDLFNDPIQKDDVFDMFYAPGKGVLVFKNGVQRGLIKGMDFKKALFGIWLGENPGDKKLKTAMLGK